MGFRTSVAKRLRYAADARMPHCGACEKPRLRSGRFRVDGPHIQKKGLVSGKGSVGQVREGSVGQVRKDLLGSWIDAYAGPSVAKRLRYAPDARTPHCGARTSGAPLGAVWARFRATTLPGLGSKTPSGGALLRWDGTSLSGSKV